MKLHFLAAGVPLTKTFTRLPTGEIDKSAYPLVRNFTSYEEHVDSPQVFYEKISAHAELGHCLSKGVLRRPLREESRAGSTAPLDPTSWTCFDLDNVHGVDSAEAFIQQVLPAAFHHVDYVLQYSASAGFSGGLRAHIFFMHDAEFTPEVAKLFITELNLNHPTLAEQLELTASGTALRYPLDRTVCQNDKLIYIAPPVLGTGVANPLTVPRIEYVMKGAKFVTFDWRTKHAAAAIENETQLAINRLRERAGLRKKTAKISVHAGELLLNNPDVALVTGEKRARGFTYLNINGGDSWGYYYSESSPRFLRNFKGEPMVVLKDFVPTYYAQVAQRLNETRQAKVRVPFAFRDRTTDTIYNGVHDTVNDRIEDLAPCSKQSLKDFFAQFDEDVPRVDDWRLAFEPWNPVRIDFKTRFCNLWEPTEYLRDTRTTEVIPPMFKRVVMSVVGDDPICFELFINWLAFIVQRRQKALTAWVLHGVQGTGKGVLFHRVLAPILGRAYCLMKQVGALEDRFNAEMQHCLLYMYDESETEDTPQGRRVVNRLKNMITEPMLEIRGMRQAAQMLPNYTSFIFASNRYDAQEIEASDRRFNVAPRQETKLVLTTKDLEVLDSEVSDIAAYLRGYKVNVERVHTALDNAAKDQMRAASQDSFALMCDAINKGDLNYFMEFAEGPTPPNVSMITWSNYIEMMKRWVEQTGKPSVVRRDEVMNAYMLLQSPPQPPGIHKFMRALAHKNLIAGSYYCAFKGETVRGFKTTWHATPEQLDSWRAMLRPKGEKQPHAVVTNLFGHDAQQSAAKRAPGS